MFLYCMFKVQDFDTVDGLRQQKHFWLMVEKDNDFGYMLIKSTCCVMCLQVIFDFSIFDYNLSHKCYECLDVTKYMSCFICLEWKLYIHGEGNVSLTLRALF